MLPFHRLWKIVPATVDEYSASAQAAHAAPARAIEHVAPISVDDCHISMLHVVESFQHSVRQIADVLALATMTEHSSSSSSALRQDQEAHAERAAEHLLREDYAAAKPAKKAKKKKASTNGKSVDGHRDGNRLPEAAKKFWAYCRLALPCISRCLIFRFSTVY